MVPVELGVNSSMKNYVTPWSGRVMPNAAQPASSSWHQSVVQRNKPYVQMHIHRTVSAILLPSR
jgi:hypothetical protein